MRDTDQDNHHDVEAGHREIVATSGARAYAAITVALCDDKLFRYGLDMHYSYGGCGFPIFAQSLGYATLEAARTAALEHLLGAWHKPFPSDPESVQRELNEMRRQIEARLAQPTLF